MELLVGVIACAVALLLLRALSGSRKQPPGPWGLPIVGYIPFLSTKPYLDLQRLAKKYGNIFRIRLGSHNIVVLNDYESTKEAFSQDVFIARPPEFAFEANDVTMRTGALFGLPWKEQRRFALHALRDLGFGKSKLEGQIQEEISDLLDHFKEKVGTPFCVNEMLAPSMSNNISALVFGRRFKYDDPTRKMLTKAIDDATKAAGSILWTLFFPWLKKLCRMLNIGDVDRLKRVNQVLKDFIRKEIDEHERTLDPNNIRDVIDGYLIEMQKRKDDPAFHKDVLEDLIGAFFGGGSETVKLSIEWLVLQMAHDHAMQRRVQAEIDEVLGRDRPPNWQDRLEMPYTEAVIMEMQRWRNLIPLNLMRYTLADAELCGYFIPRHTQVLNNLYAIHHDKEYWGQDADEYRPERFLSEDSKSVKKFDRYIPFSIGKRACPGEPLAKVEVFMYFVSILQIFDIRFPPGKKANFDADLGIGLTPKTQEVILTLRN